MGELTRAEDTAFANLDNIAKYFVSRAKLVSKVHYNDMYFLASFKLIRKSFPISV